MKPFDKGDIPILNAILQVALKMKKPYFGDFNIIRKDFPVLNKLNTPSDFEYYLEIIQSYEVAKIAIAKDTFQIFTNERTANFLQNGNGFERIYNDDNEKESQEKILRELNIKHLQKSIFQIKYWWLFLLINVILSFLISYLTSKLTK